MNESSKVRVLPTETYFSLVRQQLADNGEAYVRITGTSMRPLLHHLRDGVIIVPPERIRRGDIVLFDRRNGRYALHRVIRKGTDGFTMAGDNQWFIEQGLPYEQVVGVVSTVVRNGKRIPVERPFMKTYALALTCLTFPRIYLWKVVTRAMKPFHRHGNRIKKGEDA